MEEKSIELKKIMDDIEAGLIDDPLEDYRYLQQEARKYNDHALYEDIMNALADILFVKIPGDLHNGIMKNSSVKAEDFAAFDFMLNEAEQYLLAGQWGICGAILSNLIGSGVGIVDDEETEYRSFETLMQIVLYQKYFKSEKKVVRTPVRLSTLYGYYGSVLFEREKYDEARAVLQFALHSNPLDFRAFFEYAETFKVKKEFDTFEKLNRDYLNYAYTRKDFAHLYRNLGFAYIEKKKLFVAVILFVHSLAFEPDNKNAKEELAYIHEIADFEMQKPTKEIAIQILEQENIPAGPSEEILQTVFKNAYVASHVDHDVEKTKYFCNIWIDLTGDEENANKLMEEAANSTGSGTPPVSVSVGEGTHEPSAYDQFKTASLKKFFPEFPEVSECRMRINFTINSAKYGPTIEQILTYIEDISKMVEDKNVSLYFADLMSVAKHMDFINDIFDIANGWKSFEITINDIPVNKDDYRYFNDYLRRDRGIDISWIGLPEAILKKYKKASAPKRVTKAKPEEGVSVDIKGCTPQQIIQGIAMTYAKIYLSEYDAKSQKISDDEYVVWAEDFVVDFRVSPYGYAETINGEPPRTKPYEFCTYVIQELTYNSLFTFNLAGFKRCFNETFLYIECMRFDGVYYEKSPWNRFYVVNEKVPELRLQERWDAWEGLKYTVVLFEMDNADGSIGTGVGITSKDEKTLVKKVVKELDRPTNSLAANGVSCLDSNLSNTFVEAFLSWKGEPKAKRLEKYFRYYSIEARVKESGGQYSLCSKYAEAAASGEFSSVERKTYADIEGKKKK